MKVEPEMVRVQGRILDPPKVCWEGYGGVGFNVWGGGLHLTLPPCSAYE
jgi:hypothetical protein